MDPEGRLRGARIAVNTQTPLVRFRDEFVTSTEATVRLADLRSPEDYKFTTGGVTRMVHPLLKRWRAAGALDGAAWVALAAGESAPDVLHDGIRLSFVGLERSEQRGYVKVKERMWALLNSNPSTPTPHGVGGIPEAAWQAFESYQTSSAAAIEQAGEALGGLDALYVHDFQQLGVARAWRGKPIPKVFHLHTPFPSVLPSGWADLFTEELSRYDAVIVSTERYAANLRAAGLRTPLFTIPPFIDPESYGKPSRGDVAAFRERFHIRESDRIVVNVARMDPMKAQDRMIRALPRLLEKVPDARLLLVGNGSFSSSKRGGLGLSKGAQWRAALEALAAELRVAHRVTFTGHLEDDEIPLAYSAAAAFCLPSTREGFGLAAIEAARFGLPLVISDRAGVSELLHDRVDARVLDCGDAAALADALAELLTDDDFADTLAKAGALASDRATLPAGARDVARVLDAAMKGTVDREAYAAA